MPEKRKITQKEFVQLLSKHCLFVNCAHGMTVPEIEKAVKKSNPDTIRSISIYELTSVNKRSNDLQMTKKDGEKVYRDFHGKNLYFVNGEMLYHQNTQDDHVCTFVNITKEDANEKEN